MSGSASAARGLRPRPLSTKTPTQEDEQEVLRKATAHVGSELQKMRGEIASRAKLHPALLLVAYPVVAYLGFKICSQTGEIKSLAKKLEALNVNDA